MVDTLHLFCVSFYPEHAGLFCLCLGIWILCYQFYVLSESGGLIVLTCVFRYIIVYYLLYHIVLHSMPFLFLFYCIYGIFFHPVCDSLVLDVLSAGQHDLQEGVREETEKERRREERGGGREKETV
jgi:hypothetical protein